MERLGKRQRIRHGSAAAGALQVCVFRIRDIHKDVGDGASHHMTELVQGLNADIPARSQALDYVRVDSVINQTVR